MRRKRSGLNFNRQRRKFNMTLFKEVMIWAAQIAATVLLAAIVVGCFGSRTTVVGGAMEQTLQNNDQVFLNKAVYVVMNPKVGDVVAFLPNGNEKSHYYIRRVIATPGDRVLIQDGAVYVNGELFSEPVEVASIEEAGVASEEIVLGKDEYFLLGDNRNASEDSRYANIGNIKKEHMVGKVWFYYRSMKKMGFVD